jgi:hypothetical protein
MIHHVVQWEKASREAPRVAAFAASGASSRTHDTSSRAHCPREAGALGMLNVNRRYEQLLLEGPQRSFTRTATK